MPTTNAQKRRDKRLKAQSTSRRTIQEQAAVQTADRDFPRPERGLQPQTPPPPPEPKFDEKGNLIPTLTDVGIFEPPISPPSTVTQEEGKRRGEALREQFGSTQQRTEETRKPAGTRLVSPQAGAMGVPGALGATPVDQEIKRLQADLTKPASAPQGGTAAGGLTTAELASLQAQQRAADTSRLESLLRIQKESQEVATPPPTAELPPPPEFDFGDSEVGRALTQTQDEVNSLRAITTKDPDILNAFLPSLQAIERASLRNSRATAALVASLPDISRLEEGGKEQIKAIEKRRQDELEIASENDRIRKETADYVRDLALIDKQLIEHRNAEDEMKLMQKNIKEEQRLRRRINSLGIETDVRGLEFLNDQIRQGEEELRNLRQYNNLTSAKLNLQIGQRYKLDIDKAINTYNSERFQIHNFYDGKESDVKNTISQAKSEREKELRKIVRDEANQLNELEFKAGDLVKKATIEMLDRRRDAEKDAINAKKNLWNFAMDYIDVFGTQNKDVLSDFEKDLDLPTGSLSDQATKDELKKRRTGLAASGEEEQIFQQLLEDAATSGVNITPSVKTTLRIQAKVEARNRHTPLSASQLSSAIEGAKEAGLTANQALDEIAGDPKVIDKKEAAKLVKSIYKETPTSTAVEVLSGPRLVPATVKKNNIIDSFFESLFNL